MKLYEAPRKSTIKVLGDVLTPPGAPEISEGDVLLFHRIDGMYSLCEKNGKYVHLSASAEVEIIDNGNLK